MDRKPEIIKKLGERRNFLRGFAYDYIINGYNEVALARKYDLSEAVVISLIKKHNLEQKKTELDNSDLNRYIGDVKEEIVYCKEKIDNIFGGIVVMGGQLVRRRLARELAKPESEMDAKEIKQLMEASAIGFAMAYRMSGVPPARVTQEVNIKIMPVNMLAGHLQKQLELMPPKIIEGVVKEVNNESDIQPADIIEEIEDVQAEGVTRTAVDPFMKLTEKVQRGIDDLVNNGGYKKWVV